MLTNAVASMLSSYAEKFDAFPMALPIALEVGIGQAFMIVSLTLQPVSIWFFVPSGAFFFGQPAEEAALVLQDGLSATMEMLLSSVLLLLLLFVCSSIGYKKGGLESDLCRGKMKN
jgi:hypothetical protein